MELPYDPAIPLLVIIQTQKSNSTECKQPYVHYNHQEIEAAQVSISRGVHKTPMGYLHNGTLLGYTNEEKFTLCNSIDGPGEYYAK